MVLQVTRTVDCTLFGASLSEPHTSVTSLRPCVCVCLLGAWTNKSLPALILHIILHHALIQKGLRIALRGLTYSMSRVTEVNHINLSMLFVFVAWLTVPVTGLRSLLATLMGATGSTCPKKMAFICPCHLHMTCSVCWTSLCAECFSYAWLTVPVL